MVGTMPLARNIRLTCLRCGQGFHWDLAMGSPHKSPCPYCDENKEIIPKPGKKSKKRMLTKEERYPENKGSPKPEYPVSWFLDMHLRSLNEYHLSPHVRVRDKGVAYRAMEDAGIPVVRRTARRVQIIITSYRSRLVDQQSLYGGSAKGLVDILVRTGWVHDDSPDWCDLRITQEKVLQGDMARGIKRGTRVEIRAIPKSRKRRPDNVFKV
jgi:hypothetical protein